MNNLDKICMDMKTYGNLFRNKFVTKEAKESVDNYIKICIEEYIPEGIKEPYYKLWEKMKKDESR